MRSSPRLRLFAVLAALCCFSGVLVWGIPARAQVNDAPNFYSADDTAGTTDAYGGPGLSWNGTPAYRDGRSGEPGDRAFSVGPGGALTLDDPAAGNFGTGDFTLHLFTRLDAGGWIGQQILSKRDSCAPGSFLDLRAGPRFGGVVLELRDRRHLGFHVHNRVDVLDGAWHEITVIRAGNTVSLTVDGRTVVRHSRGVVDLDTPAPMRFGDGPCVTGAGRLGDTTSRATGELDDLSFGPGTSIIGPPPTQAAPVEPSPEEPAAEEPAEPAAAPVTSATPTPAPGTTEPQPPEPEAATVPAAEPGEPVERLPPTPAPVPPEPPAPPQAQAPPGGEPERGPAAAAFAGSLPSPSEINLQLAVVAQDAGLAVLLLALLALPIGLINDTLASNADRLAAFFERARRLRSRLVSAETMRIPALVGLALAAVVAAVEYGFIEPSFGLDISSMSMVAGLAGAFLVMSLIGLLKVVFVRRVYEVPSVLTVFPVFALVGIACVVVSRVVGLQPGLILGTLAGLATLAELRTDQEGRAAAIGATALVVIGGLCWFLRDPLVAAAGPEGAFLPAALDVALTGIVVAAAETLAFGLLPISFLEGAPLFGWSKPIWALFALLGAFAFVHVLLHPEDGAGEFAGRIGYLLALLAIYFAIAIGFWAWFRFRIPREEPVVH